MKASTWCTVSTRGGFPFPIPSWSTGERNVLFDTGCGPAACREVIERFPPGLVVNSHTHPDHFSGNGEFAACELRVPEMFAGVLPDLERMSERLAGGGEAAEQWLFMVREILGHRPVEPASTFRDGDTIDAGGLRFTAVHTPGHLADHSASSRRSGASCSPSTSTSPRSGPGTATRSRTSGPSGRPWRGYGSSVPG